MKWNPENFFATYSIKIISSTNKCYYYANPGPIKAAQKDGHHGNKTCDYLLNIHRILYEIDTNAESRKYFLDKM